jgi:hypothetical protein
MKIFRTATLLAILFTMAVSASAQTKIDPTLEVKRDFDGKIQEFPKSRLSTTLPDSVRNFNINMEYSIFSKRIKDLYEFSPLPSAQLVASDRSKFPVIYGRIGMGFPATPEFEIMLQPNVGAKNAFLVNASHYSYLGDLTISKFNEGTIGESEFKVDAQNMKNDVKMVYGRFWSKGIFAIDLSYKKDYYTYYGYNEDLISEFHLNSGSSEFNINDLTDQKYMRDSLSHTFDKLGAAVTLKSVDNRPGSFYYKFNASFSYLKDKPSLFKEFGASQFEEKYADLSLTVSPLFSEKHKFFITFGYQGANTISTGVFDRGDIEIFPHYKYEYKFLKINGGIVYNHYFSSTDTSRSNVYARVNLGATLVKDRLWAFAGIDGGNIFRTYTNEIGRLPWLAPDAEIESTNVPYSASLGLRGKFWGRFEFELSGRTAKYSNNPYYTDREDNLVTDPVHNLLTLGYTSFTKNSFGSKLMFDSESFRSGLEFIYNTFSVKEGEKAWDQSPLELSWYTRYNYRERIVVGTELFMMGKRDVKAHSEDFYLPSYNKLNFNASYIYDKNMSFYLEFNNVLNAKEYTALYYRQMGFNLRGGIIVKF